MRIKALHHTWWQDAGVGRCSGRLGRNRCFQTADVELGFVIVSQNVAPRRARDGGERGARSHRKDAAFGDTYEDWAQRVRLLVAHPVQNGHLRRESEGGCWWLVLSAQWVLIRGGRERGKVRCVLNLGSGRGICARARQSKSARVVDRVRAWRYCANPGRRGGGNDERLATR